MSPEGFALRTCLRKHVYENVYRREMCLLQAELNEVAAELTRNKVAAGACRLS